MTTPRRLLAPKPPKPLGGPAYGSIPHQPGSRLGPGDHTILPGQIRTLAIILGDPALT